MHKGSNLQPKYQIDRETIKTDEGDDHIYDVHRKVNRVVDYCQQLESREIDYL